MIEKDNKLKNLLKLLSEYIDIDDKQSYLLNELSEIYSGKYRHKYSVIYQTFLEINDESSDASNITQLLANLKYIQDEFKFENDDLKYKFDKLYDHVKLEHQREDSWGRKVHKTKLLIDDIERISEETKKMQKSLNEDKKIIRKDLERNKFDLVAMMSLVFSVFTILGVNTAIISGLFSKDISISLKQSVTLFVSTNITLLGGISFIFIMLKYIQGSLTGMKTLFIQIGISVLLVLTLCITIFYNINTPKP